ncbi:Type 1 glutamine amidotransferase-like domain-containing protein [Chloroflexi bacterium TSY]|nr:Type 1 glutamine amidotransferase-like domain-containing protein [Chloroflexi bacterium TSY]
MTARKLVLYSEQLYPETKMIDQRLLTLIDKDHPRIGYIPSKGKKESTADGYYRARQSYYARYGVDLSPYVNLDEGYDPKKLDALLASDAIHLSGGNTYYFLHWLKERNLVETLRHYVAQGGVLIGVSAGAILMTPEIGTAALCGDAKFGAVVGLDALSLVDFAIVPHFGKIEATLSDLQTYAQCHITPVYACPDGAGIVVEDDKIEFFGDVVNISFVQE